MIDLLTLIIFLLGITVAILFSLVGKINFSLLFLVPLFPLQNVIERFHQFPFGKDFIDFILVAMVLGWLFKSISNRERILDPTPLNKTLFVMIIFTYISLWVGSSYLGFSAPFTISDVRVQSWKNYMIFPLLYFIVVNNIRNLKQIKRLILFMVLSMVIMDYYTGKQISWMPGLGSRAKIEGTFVWTGVNAVAAFYAQYVFILLGIVIMCKNKLYKMIFWSLIIINIYIMLFLYSRGAYVAVVMGFLIISLIKKRIFIIPLILLLIFWQTILPKKVVERINQTQTEEGTLDGSSQQRVELWEESVKLFKVNPIIGIGFNVIPFLGWARGFKDPHNIYMKILVEQGIIGIIILLFLFWLALKSGWQLYKNAEDTFLKGLGLGFIACVFATMTTNMFGNRWTYLQLGTYFWAFLALVVRGNLIVQEQLRLKEQIG